MVDFQSSRKDEARGNSNDILLSISNVSAFYGDAQALKDIYLNIRRNEIVAVLGSNGAGKTTLLKALTGLMNILKGKIIFNKDIINGTPSHKIVRKGIATVPEGRQLFGSMTVADTLLLGTYCLNSHERKNMQEERLRMIYTLFPILGDRLDQPSNTLSGGEQQMLALGRALMSNPKFLVLDEPSLGLSPLLVKEMMNLLKRISHELNISILLVEQNARAAIKISDYIYILERGEITLSDTAQKVMTSERIQSAYLGA